MNTNLFPTVSNSEQLNNDITTIGKLKGLLGLRDLRIDASGGKTVFTIVDANSAIDSSHPQKAGKDGDWILKDSNGSLWLCVKV